MEKKRVRFYFAYNSPYAFLASSRLERELAPHAVEVEYFAGQRFWGNDRIEWLVRALERG